LISYWLIAMKAAEVRKLQSRAGIMECCQPRGFMPKSHSRPWESYLGARSVELGGNFHTSAYL